MLSCAPVDSPAPSPDALTFDEIMDAVTERIATARDGWDALSAPGAPGRDTARQKICDAIAKQRGGAP